MSLIFDRQKENESSETHQVTNQPKALENYNLYSSDQTPRHWTTIYGGSWAEDQLQSYGHQCGHGLLEAGFLANENKPQFDTHDRFGHLIDHWKMSYYKPGAQ